MASKKISELPSNLSPSLTGVTVVVDGNVTYKTTLGDLKNTLSLSSSLPILSTGTTLYSNIPPAGPGFTLVDGLFIGLESAFEASNADGAIFIGSGSGYQAHSSSNSVFIGSQSGWQASDADDSNFMGHDSGRGATNANFSNFIGNAAGYGATNANNSNFFGDNTGNGAQESHYSVFIGSSAGLGAINSSGSILIGHTAGYQASNSAFSVLMGYRVGTNFFGNNTIGKNNIIIGNSITLDEDRENSINIGSIIFGTGSFFPELDEDVEYKGTVSDGRIGINQPYPKYNFDVSGSFGVSGDASFTGSVYAPSFIGDGRQVTNVFTKNWLENETVIIDADKTLVISGDYVLKNSTLILSGSADQFTVGNLIFEKKAKLHIGGYLLIVDSDIINDGEISVAGGCILSGSSTITGTGILI